MPSKSREWKATQLQAFQLQHVTPPDPYPIYNSVPPESALLNNREEVGGDIIALTFKAAWDENLGLSAIIEDTLSSNSVMQLVTEYGDVLGDLGLLTDTIVTYKFVGVKKNGGKLLFKWENLNTLMLIH